MKKLLIFFFLLVLNFVVKAQYPVVQQLASNNTLIRLGTTYGGALKGNLIQGVYADTTEANTGYIDGYPGAIIFTTGNSTMYVRNAAATGWIGLASGLSAINIYNSDGTLSGDRILTGGSRSLTFTGLSDFRMEDVTAEIIIGNSATNRLRISSGFGAFLSLDADSVLMTRLPQSQLLSTDSVLIRTADFKVKTRAVSSIGSTYTAGNGLTLSGSQFKLGGTLSENTNIVVDNGFRMGFDLDPSDAIFSVSTNNSDTVLKIVNDNRIYLPQIFTVSSTTGRKVALIDTATGKVERIDPASLNTNIYNSDGTLTGNRIIAGANYNVKFDNVNGFTAGNGLTVTDDNSVFGGGVSNTFSGYYSGGWGGDNTFSGDYSGGWGENNIFSGYASGGWGGDNTFSGDYSGGWGENNIFSGYASGGWGGDNTFSGYYSGGWGVSNTFSGYYSGGWGGDNTFSGDYSGGFGNGLKSKSYGGAVFGTYNDSTNATSSIAYNATNRAFQIGIGTADNARANAVTVLFNGKTGINTTTPEVNLHVVGATGDYTAAIIDSHEDLTGEILNVKQSGAKKFSFHSNGAIEMAETTDPTAAATGYNRLYAQAGKLYTHNDDGRVAQVIQNLQLVFGAGSGADSDTTAFTTSAIYGSFYNDADTIVVTSMRSVLQGTSPDVTYKVWYNDSLNVEAGATALNTAGNQVTSTTTGTNVTSITNTKIPPGVWVWVKTSTVSTKPKYFSLTINGYRK